MPRDPRGHLVEGEFLTLPVWDQFDAVTAEEVARSVERCLPEPWTFVRIAWHACGDQKRHVAFFDWKGREFALIPGADIALGYDSSRPAPPAALLDMWYETTREAAQYQPEWAGITWERYLSDTMSLFRRVQLGPFLIAVHGEAKQHNTGKKERSVIAAEGFVLPTADQWEFACSAGSRSLWHWGDDPTGGPPEVNAFGMLITRNTYHQEALDEPGHYRGGDGGVREHGGCCQLEWFVPLSSWFRSQAKPEQEDWWEFTLYRRVYPLPEEMLG